MKEISTIKIKTPKENKRDIVWMFFGTFAHSVLYWFKLFTTYYATMTAAALSAKSLPKAR